MPAALCTSKVAPLWLLKTALLPASKGYAPERAAAPVLVSVRAFSCRPPLYGTLMARPPSATGLPVPDIVPPVQAVGPLTVIVSEPVSAPPNWVNVAVLIAAPLLKLAEPPETLRLLRLNAAG